ncbi:chromatin structure-remodeling complex protein SYD [Iris pallida]|uniref:Chromatin structure-remodeling complex protein SYD n=1 Tax=Iris pallida TaxID=29817 RepID=A0AAX6GKY0_IRIPA|nr:chromatin structure-remodeling complex protein SYD [Iris pallida]
MISLLPPNFFVSRSRSPLITWISITILPFSTTIHFSLSHPSATEQDESDDGGRTTIEVDDGLTTAREALCRSDVADNDATRTAVR